jgi:hypothetical protein
MNRERYYLFKEILFILLEENEKRDKSVLGFLNLWTELQAQSHSIPNWAFAVPNNKKILAALDISLGKPQVTLEDPPVIKMSNAKIIQWKFKFVILNTEIIV